MRKATTLLLILISLTSFAQHKTYRNDIFIPGTKANPTWYYAVSGEDFMAKWGLLPGDTVAFKIGANGEDLMNNVDLSMTNVNGITFLNDSSNKKDFLLGWFGLGNKCQNIKFLGNGSKYVKYGFTLWEPKNIGLSWSCVGDLEAAWFISNGNAMGVQLVAIPGVVYPLNYQKFRLHHCKILNPNQEAVYIGYVHYNGQVLIDFTGDSITVRNAGRDGIQTRNTSKTLIENNDVDSVGMLHDYGHDHGILLGDNINGAVVRKNVLKNVQGIGIWNDGWGTFTYECNDISAVNWGIMSRNLSYVGTDYTDPQEIGYSKQILKNNTITAGNGVTMESYFDAPDKTVSIEAYNNQCSGKFNLATGISFTASNNTSTSIPQCTANIPVPTPLPVSLEYFTAERKGRAVLLKWKAQEYEFSHYEIEKNGATWARVNGGQSSYSMYDYQPTDINRYRLKMIDLNGKYTYSNYVEIKMNSVKIKGVYNTAGAMLGTSTNKLRKGYYIVLYEDGSKEYLVK
jgi:hypothetical protein